MTFEEWWVKIGLKLDCVAQMPENPVHVAYAAWLAGQASAQPKWRPIETAPRKGLVDVLLLQKNGRQAVASYTHIFFDYPDGCWAYNDDIITDPVAWMPLPPPQESKS